MRTPSRTQEGLELLMEYYNQLFYLDQRFFPPNRNLGVHFHWYSHSYKQTHVYTDIATHIQTNTCIHRHSHTHADKHKNMRTEQFRLRLLLVSIKSHIW